MARKKRTKAEIARRKQVKYGVGSIKQNRELISSSKAFKDRVTAENRSNRDSREKSAKNKKEYNETLLGKYESYIVASAESINEFSDLVLPTALMWKADTSSTTDKVIDAITTIPIFKAFKGILKGGGKVSKSFTKKLDKIDKARGKKTPKIKPKKTRKQKKAEKKAKQKSKREGKLPKKKILLKGLKGKKIKTPSMGDIQNGFNAMSIAKGIFNSGDNGDSTKAPKEPNVVQKPTSKDKKGKKGKKGKDQKPISVTNWSVEPHAKNAISLVNQCCTDDKQETIKRHAFMSNVEDSLSEIAKASAQQAEDIEDATDKTQNDPDKKKGISQMVKDIPKSFDDRVSRITLGKSIKFGIMAWLGGIGLMGIIGWLKKIGGFEGLKKWLVDAITKQFDGLMDIMKSWWNDNVIGSMQSILTQLGVYLNEKIDGAGSAFLGMSDTMNKGRMSLASEEKVKGFDASVSQNTSISMGLVGAKGKDGSSKINTVSKAKWYKRVTSKYGSRILNGKKEFHSGIDVRAPLGTPVTSLDYGIVTKAGYEDGAGNVVSIYNPTTKKRIQYMHLSKIDNSILTALKDGTTINPGDSIGESGKSGGKRITAPHIHLSVRKGKTGSTLVDPMTYIEKVSRQNQESYAEISNESTTTVMASAIPLINMVKSTPPKQERNDYVSKADFDKYTGQQNSINKETTHLVQASGQGETTTIMDAFSSDDTYLENSAM